MKKGMLFLIPSQLSETNINFIIPEKVKERINTINYFIVENIRTTRRYLKKINKDFDIDNCIFYELNKHTNSNSIYQYLDVCEKGIDIGLITEAGCPGVADPGAEITAMAHKKNIRVVPLTGPSSIILALMSSGMNGQNFAFVGYLPISKSERIKKIKELENITSKTKQTQIFIETPYRNMQLLNDITNNCENNTQLCIACNITGDDEYIITKTIMDWKAKLPDINKKPAIFLIYKE